MHDIVVVPVVVLVDCWTFPTTVVRRRVVVVVVVIVMPSVVVRRVVIVVIAIFTVAFAIGRPCLSALASTSVSSQPGLSSDPFGAASAP